MENNVGSVDLDEIRKIRAELNQERGVESDSNVYENYNPNRESSQNEEPETKSVEQPVVSASSEYSPVDSSVYDNFAAFEINPGVYDSKPAENSAEFESAKNVEINESVDRSEEIIETNPNEKIEEQPMQETVNDVKNEISSTMGNEDELLDLLDSIMNDLENEKQFSTEQKTDIVPEDSNQVSEKLFNETNEPFIDIESANRINASNEQQLYEKAIDDGLDITDNNLTIEEISDEQIDQLSSDELDKLVDDMLNDFDEIDEITGRNNLNAEQQNVVEEQNGNFEIESKNEMPLQNEEENNEPVETNIESVETEIQNQTEEPANVQQIEQPVEETETASVQEKIIEKEEPEIDVQKTYSENVPSHFADDDLINLISEYQGVTAFEEMSNKTSFVGDNASNVEANKSLDFENHAIENTIAVEDNEEHSQSEDYANIEELMGDDGDNVSFEQKEQEISRFKEIEKFKFIDVISDENFKDSDKLSYIFGKNEDGEIVYGNLRDSYNLVVFGKETNESNNLVHSIILSLILKNAINEVNFVLCDSKADSKFDAYNKSSYMYFNRVAKTNKEILDTLIEVSKELEERYKLFAEIGVKSIEQYNTIAKNDNLKPLPYLLTVFNNYAKSTQLTDSDRINTCLYQILRYGRIAGLYLVLVSDSAIPYGEINYNLPTRLSFKADSVDASLETLGTAGAEKLQDNSDMLLSSVEKDDIMHLKVPTLSRAEVELLIENLEF